MKLKERARAAWAVLTEKGAADNSEQMTLNQLLNFLGVHKSGDAAVFGWAFT